MAFEGLSGKIQAIFNKLNGRGKLSESDVREAMREIKLCLLEADVNFLVVKDFIKKVSDRAVGSSVMESLTPGQQVVKIVNEEMTSLMGGSLEKLKFGSRSPAVILMAGLQGAGKTTMCAKLGAYIKKHYNKSVLLCACDIYRPAAIDQLKVVAAKADCPVFERGQADPVETARLAVDYARSRFMDLVIIDTAGRLHIDDEMMAELGAIAKATEPAECLLVIDAMTGQDAVNTAKTFHEKVPLTGVILTKLDGDTRGGAALSVRAVTGLPIKFSGIGEKLGDIEPFYPDRMASRILGMGDILTLIDKAQAAYDEKKAQELTDKMRSDSFTLDDYLEQLESMKDMGSMEEILRMLPGMSGRMNDLKVDEKAMSRTAAIIRSMTRKERNNPDVLNASRRRRIAAGSGTSVQEVNRLINGFEAARKMMKQFAGGKFRKGRKGGFPFRF